MRHANLVDDEPFGEGRFGPMLAHAGAWIGAHRGAAVMILVATVLAFYASVNALAWQDRPHPSAFFETRQGGADVHAPPALSDRDVVPQQVSQRPVTRIVFDNEPAAEITTPLEASVPIVQAPQAAPSDVDQTRDNDAVVEMQKMLAALGYYNGEVDGLKGPMTRAAIQTYKTNVGLRGIELSDAQLLTSLRNNMTVTAAIPAPRPEATSPPRANDAPAVVPTQSADPTPEADPLADRMMPRADEPVPDPLVMKIQAGLKAFGPRPLVVDGLEGDETRAAIREFQSIFRLPVTGQIDPALVQKMVAVGLID